MIPASSVDYNSFSSEEFWDSCSYVFTEESTTVNMNDLYGNNVFIREDERRTPNVFIREEELRTLNTINSVDEFGEYVYNRNWTNDNNDYAMNNFRLFPQSDEPQNNMRLVSPRIILSGENEPYTPNVDHCYAEHGLTPPTTEDTSGSDVDVVTLPDGRRLPSAPENVPVRKNQTRRAPRKAQLNKRPWKSSCHSGPRPVNDLPIKRVRHAPSRQKSKRQKLADSPPSTDDETGRRAIHNTSERHRREMQRAHLHNLRLQVPKLAENPKAPKVTILDSAKAHIQQEEANFDKKLRKKYKLLENGSKLQNKLLAQMLAIYKDLKRQGVDVTEYRAVLIGMFKRQPNITPPMDWDS